MSTTTIILHPKDGLDGEFEMRKLLLEDDYEKKGKSLAPKMSLGKVLTGKYARQMAYYGTRQVLASQYNRFENAIRRKTITPFKIQMQVVGDDRDDVSKFFPAYPSMADNFFSVDIPNMTRRSTTEKKRVGRLLSNVLRVMCDFVPGGSRYNLYVVHNGILYKIHKGYMYRTVKDTNRNEDVTLKTAVMDAASATGRAAGAATDAAITLGTRAYQYISGSPVNRPKIRMSAAPPYVGQVFERYITEGRKAHEKSKSKPMRSNFVVSNFDEAFKEAQYKYRTNMDRTYQTSCYLTPYDPYAYKRNNKERKIGDILAKNIWAMGSNGRAEVLREHKNGLNSVSLSRHV